MVLRWFGLWVQCLWLAAGQGQHVHPVVQWYLLLSLVAQVFEIYFIGCFWPLIVGLGDLSSIIRIAIQAVDYVFYVLPSGLAVKVLGVRIQRLTS